MDQRHLERKLLRLHAQLESLGDADNNKRISIVSSIATIYEQLEDDAEAIAWLLKLSEYAKTSGKRSKACAAEMVLGRLHLENQLYEYAIEHYRNAELQAPTKSKEIWAKLSQAGALSWSGRLAEAEELLLDVLGKKTIGFNQRIRGLVVLAGVYDNQHNGAEAQRIYLRCIDEMDGLDIVWQADILKSLAISYCNTDQFEKAVKLLHRAEELLTDHTNRHYWKMVYYALSVSYEELGSHADALKYHKLFRETEKAISEDKINNKLMAIQVNSKMIQVQHEREMLQQRAVELAEKNSIIEEERKKSEKLLLNILPEGVADELKRCGKVEAKLHSEVTVLFSDFSGFTGISERLTPQELIAEIDTCFSAFDRIMGKHGIEKIKTIGDAYMAVCGLPQADSDHAEKTIRAALEMRDFMADRQLQMMSGVPSFEIRIGLHSGSVIAGVVGIRKFAYDVWGDTVNTASRMESSGKVGKVNVSEATYQLTKTLFHFEPRGKVAAKGKGELEMFFVEQLPL